MKKHLTLLTLFALGMAAAYPLGAAHSASAELRRRQHAQFCYPETDFVDDYYIFGFGNLDPDEDGRINNQSDLINHRPRRLWCPIISDSHMPHADLDRVVLHGYDDDEQREVSAYACVTRYTSAPLTSCTEEFGTGENFTGDFALEIADLSAIKDRSYHMYWGYPYLIVWLPDGQTATRLTGFELCIDDAFGTCSP